MSNIHLLSQDIGSLGVHIWSNIIPYLNTLGSSIWKNLVPLAIFTTGAISFYTFIYKRPELIIETDVPPGVGRSEDEEGDFEASIMLLLANVGNDSAEEVQLTLTADAFRFDNQIEVTDYITNSYAPPQAVMDIRSGKKTGFIGGGVRHDIYLENVVYEGDVQELWLGGAIFTEGQHDLKYQVSCKEHGPRKGKISFEITDGEIEVTSKKYPTYRRWLKNRLGASVERKRTQQLENLDEDDIEFQVEIH